MRAVLSDDRLMQILLTLAILLFVSVGVIRMAPGRFPWAKWARWGAIVIFSVAVVYALVLTLRWALDQSF
jgi:protein-S-isoprenylcysteine O-methyltransferase Ste14